MERSDKPALSLWERFLDQLWNLVPWAIPALFGAAFTAGATIWGNRNAVVDLRTTDQQHTARFDKLDDRIALLADCVKRADCEAVRALVHAIDLRLKATESTVHEHNATSSEWKQRILAIESNQQRVFSDPSARPDPFTGTQARQLEERVESRVRTLENYRAVDEHRMQRIEDALGLSGIVVPRNGNGAARQPANGGG